MTYAEKLSPWCIIKLLPKMQRMTVARCRPRNDAEEHLKVLRRSGGDKRSKKTAVSG